MHIYFFHPMYTDFRTKIRGQKQCQPTANFAFIGHFFIALSKKIIHKMLRNSESCVYNINIALQGPLRSKVRIWSVSSSNVLYTLY